MSVTSTAFQPEQFQYTYPDGIENHYWTQARNRIILRFLRTYNIKGKTLEIGAGRGVVVNYLLKKEIDISGVELADAPLINQDIKERMFSHTDALDLEINFRNKVETLLILDVLEHIKDPKSFLADCEKAYPSLKNILITLPARQELWSNYDVQFGHYCRYDIKSSLSLTSSLTRVWKITNCSYFFHSLYPFALALVASGAGREIKIKAPKSWLHKFLHNTLCTFFTLEQQFLWGKLPGTSIVILIQKNI